MLRCFKNQLNQTITTETFARYLKHFHKYLRIAKIKKGGETLSLGVFVRRILTK